METFKEITQSSLGRIRKTPETPPRVSVYDVIGVITEQDANQAGLAYRRLLERVPEVQSYCMKSLV